jgi:hypothetical protein
MSQDPAPRQPSAILITRRKYTGVTGRLAAIARDGWPGVAMLPPALVGQFDGIPRALRRRDADLIALDGHGWWTGHYGTDRKKPHLSVLYSADFLRGHDGAGIRAPVIVHAFCWGGEAPFRRALARAIDRPAVAFLGREAQTGMNDAQAIYATVLTALAELGPEPDPAVAHARLTRVAADLGHDWRADLLIREQSA